METVKPKGPSLSAQVSRAVLWNTLFVPVRLLAEVLANLLKLNALSPASFGLLALISNTNNGLGTVVDLGTARALPKYIPESSHRGGPRAVLRLLGVVLAAQLALLALISAGLFIYGGPYIESLRGQVLADVALDPAAQAAALEFLARFGPFVIAAVVALLFLGVCYDMFMAYLNSFFKQRAWNSIDLAARLLPPLLSSAAILAGLDIAGVLAAMVLAPAIAVVLVAWQVGRLLLADLRSAERGPLAITGAEPRLVHGASPAQLERKQWLPPGFFRYSAVSFLMTLTDFIASAGFAVFLADDIGDVALLWAGTSVVKMVLAYLYTPMVGVQVPLFTRVRVGEGGTLLGAYQSLVRLQVLLLIPGGAGLMLLAAPVLSVLTPQYVGAAVLVWVLVPCLFAECLLTTAHNALIVYERLGIIVASRLLTLVVVVPLAIWLPPLLGLLGVALAFGLARVAAGLWVTASGVQLLGLRWPWRFTWRVALATLVMALAVWGLNWLLPALPADPTVAQRLVAALLLLGVTVLGGTTLFGVLRLTGGLDPQDKRQLAQLRLPFKRLIMRIL